MSELPDGVLPARVAEPRESALGIVLRRGLLGREVLLGQRSYESGFLPGFLAFPGGHMDSEDAPDQPGAYARCVSREVAEETGLVLTPGRWLDCGLRITPPIYAVRYQSRFFLGEVPEETRLPPAPPTPKENELLRFARPQTVLEEWERGETLVPPPVLPILRALAAEDEPSLERLAGKLTRANAEEQRAPRIEFVPGIWMLPVRTDTLPPATHTNVWMPGGRSFVILDPGTAEPKEMECLLAVVARRRETGQEPTSVVLTHHHRDHVSGAVDLARALAIPVRAHPHVLERLGERPGDPRLEPLEDGDTIGLEGMTLLALWTPGHAPGHLAFHLVESNILFGGDLVSGLSTILIDPTDGEMGTYLASLRRVRDLGCRQILPAHGPPLPGSALDEAIEHRHERESRVLAALSRSLRDVAEIACESYAESPYLPAPFIERQTLAHLIHLEGRGLARRDPSGGCTWSVSAE